jgi:hypothetical protein
MIEKYDVPHLSEISIEGDPVNRLWKAIWDRMISTMFLFLPQIAALRDPARYPESPNYSATRNIRRIQTYHTPWSIGDSRQHHCIAQCLTDREVA